MKFCPFIILQFTASLELQEFFATNQRAINKIIKNNSTEEVRLIVNMLTNIMIILNKEKYQNELSKSLL